MITVNKEVYAGIRSAFPKKEKSVLAAFDSYVESLNTAIFKSISNSKSVYKYKLFDISLEHLRGTARVRLNNKIIYLHDWIQDNYPLYEVVSLGTNLTGKISQIKLTSLATFTDPIMTYSQDLEYIQMSDSDIDTLLEQDNHNEIFKALYPEFPNGFPEVVNSKEELDALNMFHYSPIDLNSLKGFIEWFASNSFFDKSKMRCILRQARIIHAVAVATRGVFPQFKIKSPFGRIYYRGISLQSVYKELRFAALGSCVQYDVRASAMTYKMKFANMIDPTRNWNSSIFYITDRHEIIDDVYNTVFRDYTLVNNRTNESFTFTKEQSIKLIKKALTSIAFGAKSTSTGYYYDSTGYLCSNALSEIIQHPELLKRFLANFHVNRFIEDSKLIDNAIFNEIKDEPFIVKNEHLYTETKKLSKSKVIAFLYQQEESRVMKDVRSMIMNATQSKVICNVHDAIILDREISFDQLCEIEYQIRTKYNMPLWKLVVEKHDAYRYASAAEKAAMLEEEQRILEHKQLIRKLEAEAKGYTSELVEVDDPDETNPIDENKLWEDALNQYEQSEYKMWKECYA